MQKVIEDIGATFHAPLVLIGDKLGLFVALDGAEPMTPAELAAKCGVAERYVQEWLAAMAAGGYVSYDAHTERFFLTEAQALVLARQNSPCYHGRRISGRNGGAEIRAENNTGLHKRQRRGLG